ncbi:TRAP transporter large permease [Pseudorhodoplanes sinuspersici]|uniref:TRAP transporter large permease protein n=1 Tax=Pseudorhodoplanes sinuspersici TaxID=1235591 RepID=A0A1W6ZRP7_9HYPH|nr:TRAP transporter large permease [Pseudorhodoplanes sinuspersici]ARQ00032.1 C4-dicarboxylate ABC transporter permease [Pseudorhodoplanes sinuspersici]RKE71067.1 tripartite ATP-independent transporter DctM subunit [Pseudorhodoplanes sinuspersici]
MTLDSETIGIIGIVVMLILLALRMPIGIAMLLVGITGFAWLNGLPAALSSLGNAPYSYSTVYDLAVIPLFVLMGNCAAVSGMSRDLYAAAYAWLGHLRGGLASATIAACAGFAAVSGSSIASAVTMGRVCLPEMKRYKYSDALATGTVAAGGTLGILIPPSTAFVIYAILTEQSIGRLLLAGFLPGLLLSLLFILTIAIWTYLKTDIGPPGERASREERMRTLIQSGPMIAIVAISIGGIYVGAFTPSEAAAVGAFLSFALALWRRTINWDSLSIILIETVKTTAFVFLILIGAFVFGPFLALSGLPEQIATALVAMELPRYLILFALILIYMMLGMFLEGFSILVLTLAIVIPIIDALGFDLIWFGVIMVIVLEMGLISPPVGINVFVVKGLVPDVPIGEIFKGILPFWLAMGVCILLLVLFPQIVLFIPNTMIR